MTMLDKTNKSSTIHTHKIADAGSKQNSIIAVYLLEGFLSIGSQDHFLQTHLKDEIK